MTEPRPYVPPSDRPASDTAVGKPWMSLPDASQRCYRCGVLIVHAPALAAHEDGCRVTEEGGS